MTITTEELSGSAHHSPVDPIMHTEVEYLITTRFTLHRDENHQTWTTNESYTISGGEYGDMSHDLEPQQLQLRFGTLLANKLLTQAEENASGI